MEQNLYFALVCFLDNSNKFKKKCKRNASMLKTLHDRGRLIRLSDGKLINGMKSVKVPTIKDTSILLQDAHQWSCVPYSVAENPTVNSRVRDCGYPGLLRSSLRSCTRMSARSLISLFKAILFLMLNNFSYSSHNFVLKDVTLFRFQWSCPNCYMTKFA